MAVLSQLYVDVIARGFADVNAQVRSLMQNMRQANAVSNQMRDATAKMGAGGGAGMAQAASSAGLMTRALGALGPAAVVVTTALAGVYAGLKLIQQGLQGTTQLERLTQFNQAFARSVAGNFTPVVNAMSQAWLNLTRQLDNSPNLRAGIYIGLVVPMTVFVKLVESAVKIVFQLADSILKVAAAWTNGLVGGGALRGLMDVAQKKRDVTLNQTGVESGEQTFQRIQQAILKLSVPEEDGPLEAVLKQIERHADEIAKAIKLAGNQLAEADPRRLVAQQVMGAAADAVNIANNPLGGLIGLGLRLGFAGGR